MNYRYPLPASAQRSVFLFQIYNSPQLLGGVVANIVAMGLYSWTSLVITHVCPAHMTAQLRVQCSLLRC